MNNYCKKCRLRNGCMRKCNDAEIYEQGYNDAVEEFKNAKRWHTTEIPLSESTVGSGVGTNSISRVAETTSLAHSASATETAKSG